MKREGQNILHDTVPTAKLISRIGSRSTLIMPIESRHADIIFGAMVMFALPVTVYEIYNQV